MFWHAPYYRHPCFREGAIAQLGIAPGIAAWGLMTGVAMVKLGLGVPASLVMTLVVFAGSAQLATIPPLLGGAPMWVVLVTAFCVNLRFVVFSAHLRHYMMHLPRWHRLTMGYLSGDLPYVLFVQRFPQPAQDEEGRLAQMAYLCAVGSTNWATWLVFNLSGVLLAQWIPSSWGFGFAGVLALSGVLWSLADTRLRLISAATAGVAAVLAAGLPLKLNILVGIAAAVALCLLLEKQVDRVAQEESV
jgi:predicted branched-subunit amino acid permease